MPVTFRERALWGRAQASKITGTPAQYPEQIPEILKGLYRGPSLSVQPRLPGTVVGERSMLAPQKSDKVTAATGPISKWASTLVTRQSCC